jgi:hydrogenase nickel incorporation protein HypA/HybF
MHEMSIALRIIDIATAALPPSQADLVVESVNVEIGRLTAVVPSSLRFCFEIASRDTAIAGAQLVIEEIPVVVVCGDCHAESEQEGFPLVCASCHSSRVDLLCGRELMVTSIEVADPEERSPT